MKTSIFLLTLLAGGAAMASAPAKSPTCAENIKLKHPNGSGGVFFDADCKIAYVLPPSVSDAVMTNMMGTSNLKLCKVINSTIRIQQTAMKDMETLMGIEENDDSVSVSPIERLLKPKKEPRKPLTLAELRERRELMKEYEDINKNHRDLMDQYKDYQAASAVISFRLPWDKLVQSYANLNGSSIQFRRLPITSSYLTFNRTISKSGTQAAVIDYDIPGLGSNNFGNNVTASSTDQSSLLAGDAYSGQVVLSLAGACQFVDEATGALRKSATARDITSFLNANMNYTYDLQVYRRYTISYDLSLLAKKIQERSSSGGFFTTSASVSEINTMENSDWFQLDNVSNDSRFNFELDVKDLKADLMNRVIRDVTMLAQYNPEDAPQVVIRSKNGAQAGSEALAKCPHLYCQVGAMSLAFLDSVYGSSSATSTYIDQKHGVAGDRVNDTKMLSFSGSSSFR